MDLFSKKWSHKLNIDYHRVSYTPMRRCWKLETTSPQERPGCCRAKRLFLRLIFRLRTNRNLLVEVSLEVIDSPQRIIEKVRSLRCGPPCAKTLKHANLLLSCVVMLMQNDLKLALTLKLNLNKRATQKLAMNSSNIIGIITQWSFADLADTPCIYIFSNIA